MVTYTSLAHLWATNITIKLTSGSLIAATSSVVTVSAGPFSKLLVLLPGESSAPGTATGRSGTASATAGSSTAVRVFAADDYFNPVAGVTDTVGITSSDANAVVAGGCGAGGRDQHVRPDLQDCGQPDGDGH